MNLNILYVYIVNLMYESQENKVTRNTYRFVIKFPEKRQTKFN